MQYLKLNSAVKFKEYVVSEVKTLETTVKSTIGAAKNDMTEHTLIL